MSEKKMVRRSVAIALGIVCIVLVAGLVGGFGYFILSINDKDNTISSLNAQISSKDSQISQLNSNVTNLQNQVNDLNSTVNDLNKVVNLEKTQYWAGGELREYNANSSDGWSSNPNYAGYIRVDINSNTTNTYVRVFYYSHGVNYNNQVVVGTGITHTFFPVLPTLFCHIIVGNTNSVNGALIGVTIIYYY